MQAGMAERTARRRVVAGRWDEVLPSVYRFAGAPESWPQAAMAAVLWAGPGAAASHLTAGRLWGLDGVDVRTVEVTVPRGRGRRCPGVVVHRARLWTSADRTVRGGVPVTTAARTLVDLASALDLSELELALEDALRRHLVNPAWLARRLRQVGGQGRKGSKQLRKWVEARFERTQGTDSALEARVLQLIARFGLPRPLVQYEVDDGDWRLGQFDFAYPEHKLALEAHGQRYHLGVERWEEDQRRASTLAAAGWRLIPLTWDAVVRRPKETAAMLRQALAARGR